MSASTVLQKTTTTTDTHGPSEKPRARGGSGGNSASGT
eukprot:CAMPEP_0172919930 /NCGR_PEP_ID=MMETSP1075-20121228/203057_1 /TAXON_ID=2916 /ORGANISM="Ceratium fusus, Strain PA161109" /LENGTH=37 /DNA_ID= /DNA_START= /DNA_END= /DNA_ORIENTATION=